MTTDCGLRGLDLLDVALDHIEANPQTWYQRDWRCSTGMCLAGHLADMTGGQWQHAPGEIGSDLLVPLPGEETDDYGNGCGTPAWRRAEYMLGFPAELVNVLDGPHEERDLFDGLNSLADLKRMRDDLRAHFTKNGAGA